MLKNIPSILSPELLKVMMEMGHSDKIAIVDGNFPSWPHPANVIRCDGHGVPEILDALLQFMPLDTYVDNPAFLMKVEDGDPYVPEIWDEFRAVANKHEKDGLREIEIDRQKFYNDVKDCYAVITTSESALYANIIIQKGVVIND